MPGYAPGGCVEKQQNTVHISCINVLITVPDFRMKTWSINLFYNGYKNMVSLMIKCKTYTEQVPTLQRVKYRGTKHVEDSIQYKMDDSIVQNQRVY